MRWFNSTDTEGQEFEVISWQTHKKKPSLLIVSKEANPQIADAIANDAGETFEVVGKEFLDYDARFFGYRILITMKRDE